MLKAVRGVWGRFGEGDGELAGLGVGGDGAGELDVGGEAVGDEEEAVAVAGLGLAEVDEAGEGAGEGGAFDGEAADLGVFGTVGFFVGGKGTEQGFGVGTGGLAVGGTWIDREAFGEGDCGGAQLRGGGNGGAELLGDFEVDVDSGGGVGGGGGGLGVEAGVKAELITADHLRPSRFSRGFTSVVREHIKRRAKRGFAIGRILEEGSFWTVGRHCRKTRGLTT